jgi:hypothetical protein
MEKMSIIRNPYLKAAQQQGVISVLSPQALTGVSQGNLITVSNNTASLANTIRKDVNRWPEVQTNCIEIKEHEAFNTPINTLLDLWLTRYGNEWIDLEDIEKDEFFAIAYKRLKQMGELEQHYLTDRARYVCRKPE